MTVDVPTVILGAIPLLVTAAAGAAQMPLLSCRHCSAISLSHTAAANVCRDDALLNTSIMCG